MKSEKKTLYKHPSPYRKYVKILTVSFLMIFAMICISLSLFCYFHATEEQLYAETITMIEKVFGINLSNFDFKYQNTLECLKSGGSIKVQLITDSETAESLRKHCEEKHFRKDGDGTSDFPVFTYELAKEIGCSAEILLGNVYYKHTYQQQRTIHNAPFFSYQSHRNHATHFVYFIDNSDGTITTHFEYNEPSYDWIRYSHVQYMILFVQLCVLLFLLYIIHSKKCLCFYVVKKILGINISNMNFEYENTLHWLTPTGRLLLKLPLRAEQTDKLFETFSASNPDATTDFQKADELLSEFPNFEEAEPVASVLAYQPQVRWTLFGYKKACTLLLHLTKLSDGQMILYLYYKENG